MNGKRVGYYSALPGGAGEYGTHARTHTMAIKKEAMPQPRLKVGQPGSHEVFLASWWSIAHGTIGHLPSDTKQLSFIVDDLAIPCFRRSTSK